MSHGGNFEKKNRECPMCIRKGRKPPSLISAKSVKCKKCTLDVYYAVRRVDMGPK